MADPKQFVVDLAAFKGHAIGNMEVLAREVAQDLAELVVVNTPVQTGFLRGSWFGSLNQLPVGKGAVGRDVQASITLAAGSLQLGDILYVGNTAAYAAYVENRRHWVAAAVASAPRIVAAAAARIMSGQLGGANPGGGAGP